MLNLIPVVGWLLSLFFAFSLAIPFWLIWNQIGAIYFYFLPEVYHQIPFWHCVGLFMIMPIIKSMFIPRLASSSSTSSTNKSNA